MKVFAYIRVSGKSQVEGDGPERQRIAIAAFAQRHGLTVVGEFFDEGVSGTVDHMDRPKLAEAMLTAKEQGVDALLAESADRLARDLIVQEYLFRECRELGLKVFVTNRDFIDVAADDPNNPNVAFLRGLFGLIAQLEKSNLVLKLRSARERKRQQEGRCEGVKPYGFFAEEQVIKGIIQHLVDAQLSMTKIAEMLNQEGHKTRTGKPWNYFSVLNVFKQRRLKKQ